MTVRHTFGFTYVGVLVLTALLGIALAGTGVIWSTLQQSEKEEELLFVGEQFRKAIGSYYEETPGTVKRYPPRLEDLVEDSRHLAMLRHLRRVYRDPMTGNPEWGILRASDGGVMGVFSLSRAVPIKKSGFGDKNGAFDSAKTYQEWRFVYVPAN